MPPDRRITTALTFKRPVSYQSVADQGPRFYLSTYLESIIFHALRGLDRLDMVVDMVHCPFYEQSAKPVKVEDKVLTLCFPVAQDRIHRFDLVAVLQHLDVG